MEVRFHATTAGPLRPPVLRAIKELLGEEWVVEAGKQQALSLAVPAGGGPPSPQLTSEDISRVTARDRTRLVTIRPDALTVEATRYGGYDDFRSLLARAFDAAQRVLTPDGVARLGLRYIDEIQVGPGPVDWSAWVHGSLLAPHAQGLTAASWTGAVQYSFGDDRNLVLRYGPSENPVVSAAGPLLRVRAPKPWPVFVLDFDSFWEPADIPAFEATTLVAACDELRSPVRRLFDQLSTPELLQVYRGEVPS